MKKQLLFGASLVVLALSGCAVGSSAFRIGGSATIQLESVQSELRHVALTGKSSAHCSLDSSKRLRIIDCNFYVPAGAKLQLPPGTGGSPYDRCDAGELCTNPRFWYEGREYNAPIDIRVSCLNSVGNSFDLETTTLTCTPDNRPPPLLSPPANGQSLD